MTAALLALAGCEREATPPVDRAATDAEITAMRGLAREALESGAVDIAYGDVTAADGLAGVAAGGGAAINSVDLSATGGGATGDYELFDGFGKVWDIVAGTVLNFIP